MIFRRQIISGSAGPIFAIFSPNENVLGADDRSGPFFSISQGTLPWQPILRKNGKLRTFVALWHSETEWDNAVYMHDFNSATNATISCKSLVKICPVVSAENSRIEIALRVHVVVRRISSNISGSTGLIFAIFSPYESALCADDGSVPYFPICQGTLPW